VRQREELPASPPGLPLEGLSPREKPQLRPIPTPYAGYIFRSLLEARWAVFFDALAIKWHYEIDSVILSPFGERYRPDFYLPQHGCYIEVKPPRPDKQEQRKAYLLNYCLAHNEDPAKSRERAFVLHGGIPWPYPKEGNIIGFSASSEQEGDPSLRDLCWQVCPMCHQVLIGRINTFACGGCEEELGLLVDDALDNVAGIPMFDQMLEIVPAMVSAAVSTKFFRSGHMMPALQEAYAKARAARLEGRRRRPS
jgi:hypothetical protein